MTIQERLKSFRMQVSSGIDAFCEELLKNGCKKTYWFYSKIKGVLNNE